MRTNEDKTAPTSTNNPKQWEYTLTYDSTLETAIKTKTGMKFEQTYNVSCSRGA